MRATIYSCLVRCTVTLVVVVWFASTGCSFLSNEVGEGEECLQGGHDQDFCEEGLVCSYVFETGPHGICIVPREVGETCEDLGDCKVGLVCKEETCRPPDNEGEPCKGFSCVPYSGLACNFGFDPPICTFRGDIGDPCGSNLNCEPEDICAIDDDLDDGGVCAAVPTGPGGYCMIRSDCPDGYDCTRDNLGAHVCLQADTEN